MGIERAEVIARMRVAFKTGMSASSFIKAMKSKGLSYRRTTMLTDWRNVNQLVVKEGLVKFIRKGYVPSSRIAEIKAWKMSKEYMYKIRSERILRKGLPPEITFINIMSDNPLTITEVEREAFERSFKQSPPRPDEERKFSVISLIHRAEL